MPESYRINPQLSMLITLARDAIHIEDSKLARHGKWRNDETVKMVTHRGVKRQEGRRRVAAARQAQRSAQAATLAQRRTSLVGSGAKWRITNLRQVAKAMATWA
jgi:hypothetical protein